MYIVINDKFNIEY